jgi:peroxiredoxin
MMETSGDLQCASISCLELIHQKKLKEWSLIKNELDSLSLAKVVSMVESELNFGFKALKARFFWDRFQSDSKSQFEVAILSDANEISQRTPEWVNFLNVLIGLERSYVSESRFANYSEELMTTVLDRLAQKLNQAAFDDAASTLVRTAIRRNPDFDYLPRLIQKYKVLSQNSKLSFLVEQEHERLLSVSLLDFKLKDRQGTLVQLNEYKQKIVVLDFWASYCAPCIKAMPLLSQIEEKFRSRNDVVFLKVSIDKDESLWNMAVDKHSITGKLLIDPAQHLFKALKITAIPHMSIVGRDGLVIRRNISSHAELNEAILSLL